MAPWQSDCTEAPRHQSKWVDVKLESTHIWAGLTKERSRSIRPNSANARSINCLRCMMGACHQFLHKILLVSETHSQWDETKTIPVFMTEVLFRDPRTRVEFSVDTRALQTRGLFWRERPPALTTRGSRWWRVRRLSARVTLGAENRCIRGLGRYRSEEIRFFENKDRQKKQSMQWKGNWVLKNHLFVFTHN